LNVEGDPVLPSWNDCELSPNGLGDEAVQAIRELQPFLKYNKPRNRMQKCESD
jgi:hypothetical protein